MAKNDSTAGRKRATARQTQDQETELTLTSEEELRWCVYMVRCIDDSLYTGITTNVTRRIAQHNGLLSGGASYTRGRRPVTLVFTDFRQNRADASRLEWRIKKLKRTEKEALQRMNLSHTSNS